MIITVDAEGRIVDTEIVRGSGSKMLDRRAVAIVLAAAPYGRFTRGDAKAGRPDRDPVALSLHARRGPRDDAERRNAVSGVGGNSGSASAAFGGVSGGVSGGVRAAPRAAMPWPATRSSTASRPSSTRRSRARPARRCVRAAALSDGWVRGHRSRVRGRRRERLQRDDAVQVRGLRAGLAQDRTRRVAGACNTLRFDDDGWFGDNTDGAGLVRDIERNAGVALPALASC